MFETPRVLQVGQYVLLGAVWLAGCSSGREKQPCDFNDPTYARTQGAFDIDYRGWAGVAPRDQVRMFVKTEAAEAFFLEGCGYAGDDYWWVNFGARGMGAGSLSRR